MKRSVALTLLISMALPAQAGWADVAKNFWNSLMNKPLPELSALVGITTGTAALGMYVQGALVRKKEIPQRQTRAAFKKRLDAAKIAVANAEGYDHMICQHLQVIARQVRENQHIESKDLNVITKFTLTDEERKLFIQDTTAYTNPRDEQEEQAAAKRILSCIDELYERETRVCNADTLDGFTQAASDNKKALGLILLIAQGEGFFGPALLGTLQENELRETLSSLIDTYTKTRRAKMTSGDAGAFQTAQQALIKQLNSYIALYDELEAAEQAYKGLPVALSAKPLMNAGHFFTGMTLGAAIIAAISHYWSIKA